MTHFCQILQGAVSDYHTLISSGLFPASKVYDPALENFDFQTFGL